MPVILIFPVIPKGGYLHKLPTGTDGHRPMFDAGGDCVGKQFQHLIRDSGGGNVPVVGGNAQNHIPHASADNAGGISVRGEDF